VEGWDPGVYGDADVDEHTDGYPDEYADEDTDGYTDGYADGHADEYTDIYADEYADSYADEHADVYTGAGGVCIPESADTADGGSGDAAGELRRRLGDGGGGLLPILECAGTRAGMEGGGSDRRWDMAGSEWNDSLAGGSSGIDGTGVGRIW